MLSRAAFDSAQNLFAILAFLLIAGGFLFFVFKAIFMKKGKVDRMSSLPLDDEEKARPKNGKEKSKDSDE